MDELIASDLEDVLVGGKKYVFTDVLRRERGIDSFIEAINERGNNYTVIEVMAPDREGFLYEVTQVFSRNGVNITNGKIYTEQNIANDVFYVNVEGKMLSNDCLYELVGDLWQSVRFREDT